MSAAHNVLAKTLTWALQNKVEISVGSFKEDGVTEQIEINLKKDGRGELIRLYDIEDITRPIYQNLIKEKASNLCLSRLEL